jgi:Histidine kinase-, DNA gyrase B-, and HSP90-like ATPase
MTTPVLLAVAHGERMLARAAALFRVGSVLLLLGAVLVLRPGTAAFAPVLLVSALAAVQGLAFAVAWWRLGRLPSALVAVDLLGTVLVLGLTSSPLLVPGPVRQSPLYGYGLFASFEVGIVGWRLWVVLLFAVAFTLVTLASSDLFAASTYPLWAAAPDSVAFPAAALIAWLIGSLVRYVHREQDDQRLLAAERAADLARARERARQSAALGAGLVSTLEAVLACDAVSDPALADQIRQEAGWLRRVVDAGLTDPEESILEGLRDLVAEKLAIGLQVRLEHPDAEPALTAAARAALLGGAREALTNVAKHSRVNQAVLRLTVADGWVTLLIADQGKGYQQSLVPPGTGQRGSILGRLAEAGGRAIVRSAPDRGTQVILRVPEGNGVRGAVTRGTS